MIYAVKHNKVNRGLYKANEDSLTASVFERLMYLPKELFQHILEKALYDVIPGLELQTLGSIDYWPNWDSESTSNSSHVQPDIFIRTLKADIIIETKRFDENQQNPSQWKNQVIAYNNEFGEEQKELIYVALGGLRSKEPEHLRDTPFEIKIYKCSWRRLMEAVKEVLFKLEHSYNLMNNNVAINNILSDIVLCFGMYGYSTADWLERFIRPSKISSRTLKIIQELNTIEEWKN